MSHGFLLIDGMHLMHRANNGQALTVGTMPVQAIFGFLRTLRPAVAMYSMFTPIVLWDGISWRREAFAEYKANRDKEPESKAEIEAARLKKQLTVQKPFVQKALKALGVRQLVAMNLEADDLAAILCRRYVKAGKKVLMVTGDKDWVQLLGPGIGWIDPIHNVKLNLGNLQKRLGYCGDKKRIIGLERDRTELDNWIPVPSPRAWLEMKALMGDTSDNLSGVGGIGEKGAIELITKFGSVGAFWNAYNDGSLPKLPKKLADFAEDAEKHTIFTRNMRLMDLNSSEIPAPLNLKATHEPLDVDAFTAICEELAFKSILTDVRGWTTPFGGSHERAAA